MNPNGSTSQTGPRCAYDALLVAIGAEPVSELLAGNGGIATDACGRTAHEGVFACGDVASFGGRRVEHWTSASGRPPQSPPRSSGAPGRTGDALFWSDQFGLRLQMVGTTAGWANVELEGGLDSFRARYVDPKESLSQCFSATGRPRWRPRDASSRVPRNLS